MNNVFVQIAILAAAFYLGIGLCFYLDSDFKHLSHKQRLKLTFAWLAVLWNTTERRKLERSIGVTGGVTDEQSK